MACACKRVLLSFLVVGLVGAVSPDTSGMNDPNEKSPDALDPNNPDAMSYGEDMEPLGVLREGGHNEPADPILSADKVKSMFLEIDANSDGMITSAELHAFGHGMGKKRSMLVIDDTLVEYDLDMDGKVSRSEALAHGHVDPEMKDHIILEADKMKFVAADKDLSDDLDKEELVAFLFPETDFAVEEAIAVPIMERVDSDKDGKLTLSEFAKLSKANGQITDYEREVFDEMDKNKDGFLEVREFASWESGRHYVERAMEGLVIEADQDMDGHVTLQELLQSMKALEDHESHMYLEDWSHGAEL